MTGSKTSKPVVVTTEHRGVFFGYTELPVFLHPADGNAITLTDVQMCVYWNEAVKGVVGLAATGPVSGCKVTAAAPSMLIRDVTAVMEATEEAAKAWQTRPWR